jgi:hypothetical protein
MVHRTVTRDPPKVLARSAQAEEDRHYLRTLLAGSAAAFADVGGIALIIGDAGSGAGSLRSNDTSY